MKRILFFIGDATTGWKMHSENLNRLSISTLKLFHEDKISDSPLNEEVKKISELIRGDGELNKKARLFYTYNLARNCYKSYSFRIRLLMILFGKYRIKGITSFKIVLRHMIKNNFFLAIIIIFFSLIRFPKLRAISLLTPKTDLIESFENLIEKIDPSVIVLFSSGSDNFSFIFEYIEKPLHRKYVLIINNWDNISSKSFISNRFDLVCLWNKEQIFFAQKYNRIAADKLVVVGSITADKAYLRYGNSYKGALPRKKNLLFIGQQNAYDELSEILKINAFIRTNNCYYNNLTYRPHPISNQQNRRLLINSTKLENIEIDDSSDIDLRYYDGIITLPTTFLLEVILSKRPFIVYSPYSSVYRMSPNTMWNYNHFDRLKKMKICNIAYNFNDLIPGLTTGFNSPQKINMDEFYNIFPFFTSNYYKRITSCIEKL